MSVLAVAPAFVFGWASAGMMYRDTMPGEYGINGTILLTGDTPKDLFIPAHNIFNLEWSEVPSLKNRSGMRSVSTGVPLNRFLAAYGVANYDSLVIYADDYEAVIEASEVTDETILVPDDTSARLVSGNLPVCSWVKNIRYIVVVGSGAGSTILLNGRPISYGSILDDGITTLPFARSDAGFVTGGREFDVETGGVAEGVTMKDLLFEEGYTDFSDVTVSGGGTTEHYNRTEVLSGSLFLTRYQGVVKLATNSTLQPEWKTIHTIDVVS
ncbi:MAG TPA: hypothetical protein VK436_08990 [Methanocella sp.]|nr:hypothetical protein [Methanocella sp.]